MFLVVNAAGKYWNGFGWSQKGKEYLTPASAVRSLQEEGEDLDRVSLCTLSPLTYRDTKQAIPSRSITTRWDHRQREGSSWRTSHLLKKPGPHESNAKPVAYAKP